MSSPAASSSTQWANVEQVRPSVVTAVSCSPTAAGSVEPAAVAASARLITQSYICGPYETWSCDAVHLTEPGHQRPVAGRADHGQPVGPGGVAREGLLGEPRNEQPVEPDDLIHRVAGGDGLGHQVGGLGERRQHDPVGRRGGDRGGLVGERHPPGRIGQGRDLDPACRQLGGEGRGELIAVDVVAGHDHHRRRRRSLFVGGHEHVGDDRREVVVAQRRSGERRDGTAIGQRRCRRRGRAGQQRPLLEEREELGGGRGAGGADDHAGALLDQLVDGIGEGSVRRLLCPHRDHRRTEHTAGGVDLVDGEGEPALLTDRQRVEQADSRREIAEDELRVGRDRRLRCGCGRGARRSRLGRARHAGHRSVAVGWVSLPSSSHAASDRPTAMRNATRLRARLLQAPVIDEIPSLNDVTVGRDGTKRPVWESLRCVSR